MSLAGLGGWRDRSGRCGGTGRAVAPVHDFGLVDGEAVVVDGVEAGAAPGCAVDVVDVAAGPADEVVVVVPGARFIARGVARRFDAAQQTCVGEGPEDVVDGLS